MAPTIQVEMESEALERARADLTVVAFSPRDRPLRYSAGRADWRLCGRLSELIASHKLTGDRAEAALISVNGGLRSPLLLVLGLGERERVDASSWLQLGRSAVRRALGLRCETVALGLLADMAERGSPSDGIRAVLSGAARAVAEHAAGIRLLWVAEPGATAPISDLDSLDLGRLPAGIRVEFPKSMGRQPNLPAPESRGFDPIRFPPVK